VRKKEEARKMDWAWNKDYGQNRRRNRSTGYILFFAIEIEIDSKDTKFKPKFEPFQNRKLGIWFKDSKCKPVTF
jgi:hypothetical protein